MLSHIIKLILFGVILYNLIKYITPQLIRLFRYLKTVWTPFYKNTIKPFIKTKILPYWREIYFDDGSKKIKVNPFFVQWHWGYPKFRTQVPDHYMRAYWIFVIVLVLLMLLVLLLIVFMLDCGQYIYFVEMFYTLLSSPILLVKLLFFFIKCLRFLLIKLVVYVGYLIRYLLIRSGCWGYWKWQYDKFWKLYLKALKDTGLGRADVRYDLRFIWDVIIYNFFLYLMSIPFVLKMKIQSSEEIIRGIKIFLKKHGRWLWLAALFFLMLLL